MIIALIWIVLCFFIAGGASSRGRSGVGWFFISALLSPVIAIIMLVCLPAIVDTPVEPKRVEPAEKDDKDWKAYQAWLEEQGLDSQGES